VKKCCRTEKRRISLSAELARNDVESRERRAGAATTCANEITRNLRVLPGER